ncbi:unnamed protein product [Zymoseptoria tritici ST99CH_3D1]|nr:unnamed protein product [Zymoseptoria tritici ST99CH_3D1]
MSGVPDFNNTSSPTLQPPPSSASCKSEAPANEQGDNNEMPEEWEGDTVEDKEFGPYPEFDDMLAERGRDPFHAEIDEACKPYKVGARSMDWPVLDSLQCSWHCLKTPVLHQSMRKDSN